MRAVRTSALLWAGASILLASSAQLAMRWGMMRLPPVATLLALTTISNGNRAAIAVAAGGVCCYAVSMICWLAALRGLPLRLAYPLLSISYVVVYLVAGLAPAFAERLTWTGSLGVLLVATGVVLLIPDSRLRSSPRAA